MGDETQSAPPLISPYVVQEAVNEPITLATGDFTLRAGEVEVELSTARVAFELLGSKGVMFEGTPSSGALPAAAWEGELVGECEGQPFECPVYVTSKPMIAGLPGGIRGRLRGAASVGDSDFSSLRFCLGNLEPTWPWRVELPAPDGVCYVQAIREVSKLARQARVERGHVLTHVGCWEPASGKVSAQDAQEFLELLRLWFGFVRGAWSGPLLPQGLDGDTIVWRQFADWRLTASGLPEVSWYPGTAVDLSPAFTRFAELRSTPTWRHPLKMLVSWLVEALSRGLATDSKIVMALVALEMLAWVQVVESERFHSEGDFHNMSAAGKIRAALSSLDIPLSTPDQLASMPGVPTREAFDGPGLITWVRNKIVHATAKNRAKVKSLSDGLEFHRCAQLALEYLELGLLAVLKHQGRYWSRTGQESRLVPWA